MTRPDDVCENCGHKRQEHDKGFGYCWYDFDPDGPKETRCPCGFFRPASPSATVAVLRADLEALWALHDAVISVGCGCWAAEEVEWPCPECRKAILAAVAAVPPRCWLGNKLKETKS